VANVVDEADEDDQFLIPTETWANMLLDKTGRITANQINLIVDHFGSRGRLVLSSDGSKKLIQAHLQKPPNDATAAKTEIKLVITYEVKIIVIDEYGTTPLAAGAAVSSTNDGLNGNAAIIAGTAGATVPQGEEGGMFSSKTFAFTNGKSLAGVAVATALAGDLDASGAPKSGRDDCLRFRKTYCVESAAPVTSP
jgi:hypothetical protein